MTYKLDIRVKHGAKLLNDFELFATIDDGDMVVMEKKYHNHCSRVFYKRVDNITKNELQMEKDNDCFLWDCLVRSNKP